MPKVSIIIPVYNAEKALRKCIDSVLNQEYKDFELLLMDDGSKDSSPSIIDEYAEKDARVRAVHKKNSGVSDTRNMAIDMATGAYLQFLDADDWITPDATKLFVRAIEVADADMVIADFYRVVGEHLSQKGDIDTDRILSRKDYADYMLSNPADYYYGVIWNKFYKKELLDRYKLRMDAELSYCEDFIFNMEYLLHAERIAVVKSPIYYYVKTEGSLVSQNMNLTKIVNMKTNVMQYYDRFYRNVFDEEEYDLRRAQIAGFLIDFAKDDFVIPGTPISKKLGTETVSVQYLPDECDTVFSGNYYRDKLLEYYLKPISIQNDLKTEDLRILLYMHQAANPVTEMMVVDYTKLPLITVVTSLQKLKSRYFIKSIRPAKDEANASFSERYRAYYVLDNAKRIEEQLDEALKDFDNLRYQGLSEDEKAVFKDLEKRSMDNIKSFLKSNG